MYSHANARAGLMAAQKTIAAIGRAMNAVRSLVDDWRRHREARRAIQIMSAMSDHQLRDLGIGRSQIVRVATFGHPDRDY